MAAPQSGTIGPWCTREDVLLCCPGLKDNPSTNLLDQAITFATNILWRATGRQFPGTAPREGVRPCRGYGGSGCGCSCGGGEAGGWGCGDGPAAYGGWNSFVWDAALGGWNTTFPYAAGFLNGCGCGGGCNGCALPGVVLPSPVVSVEQVVINGLIIDPSEYAVQDYRTLVRYTLDANGCLLGWPCENRRSNPSDPYPDPNNTDGTRNHTWQIDYTYGRGPGPDGVIACARYACELAQLWLNAADPNCRLPYRVQQINREGLSMSMIDPSLFLQRGMTGLPEVDQYVQSVNPAATIRRSSVQRLGRPSRNITTITG